MSGRADAEHELSKAISRYVGYTTGATYINRIAGLTEYFEGKPFRYDIEVIRQITDRWDLTDKTAKGVVDFATSLGFIDRFEGEGSHARLSLSNWGRAYRGAEAYNDEQYRRFILTFLLLEFDADLYGLLLDFAEDPPKGDWVQAFKDSVQTLREGRLDWLYQVLTADILVRRVAEHVRWLAPKLKNIEILPVGDDFIRHHSTPRRGWAREVGHTDSNGEPTAQGKQLIDVLRAGRARYFWIGPDLHTLHVLGIESDDAPPPLGPAWNLLRPGNGPVEDLPSDLVQQIGEFMIEQYGQLRLLRSNQAPVDAVKPFLYWKESSVHGVRYEERLVFEAVFSRFGDKLAPLSGRGRRIAHYQLRAAR